VFADFARFVPDAMTHWQHPRFFAYFPANAAPASMLAEQLANAMAAQAMLWQTAPAANEMEALVVDWLRDALGLPTVFHRYDPRFGHHRHLFRGADNARESAGLCRPWKRSRRRAAAAALRIKPDPQLGRQGGAALGHRPGQPGEDPGTRERSTPFDGPRRARRGDPGDLAAGFKPAGVILATGGTSIGACDDLTPLIAVANAHGLPTHVDAAWAGSAMIAPEFRHLWAGVDQADSIVFNPHKWLGAQFDAAVQFLVDPGPQIATMGLRPDYLKTQGAGEVVNYNEWTLPLGRRFRALKIWFLLRIEGLQGLRSMIRNHVAWAQETAQEIAGIDGFEIVTGPILSLFTFRYRDDTATAALLEAVNREGRIYLTQTTHAGRFVIRVQVGPWGCTREDVLTIPRELAAQAARL
jgi:aromatic-L-amino-acid decarboxylase